MYQQNTYTHRSLLFVHECFAWIFRFSQPAEPSETPRVTPAGLGAGAAAATGAGAATGLGEGVLGAAGAGVATLVG